MRTKKIRGEFSKGAVKFVPAKISTNKVACGGTSKGSNENACH